MPQEILWFETMQRIAAVGALAVRLEKWKAIPALVLNKGKGRAFESHPNWYRHSLTHAARADLIWQRQPGTQVDTLLSYAQQQNERLACLRFDLPDGDPEFFGSLCQFDFLVGIVAIGDAKDPSGNTYYPSFARYYEERTRPVVEALLDNAEMRHDLFPLGDEDLAVVLRSIDDLAARDAQLRAWSQYFGSEKVRKFVTEHWPKDQ